MKTISTLAMLLILAAASRAAIPPGWSTDFDDSISAAETAQRPALVFFTASWCGPCKLMASVTLADPAVQGKLAGLERIAVDIDEHPDLASKYGVEAVPTFVMLSTGEAEVERTTGYQPAADFSQWLATSGSEAQAAMVRQSRVKKSLADVDQLIVATGTDSIRKAAATLFDLCDERDPAIVKLAAGRLIAVADRDPSILLDGLKDPRLATRIEVANVLELKIGSAFDIDPWSGASTRETKIRAWRDHLPTMPASKGSD